MTIVTCPTDIVRAPAERVWQLLTDPEAIAMWSESKLRTAPTHRPIRPGDRVLLGGGPRGLLGVSMDIVDAQPPARLTVDVRLPFGITNHEVVVVSPVSADSCRLTFN